MVASNVLSQLFDAVRDHCHLKPSLRRQRPGSKGMSTALLTHPPCCPQILSVIPAAILTGLLYLKPVTSMLLLLYTQRHYVSRGDMSIRSESIVALIAQVRLAD